MGHACPVVQKLRYDVMQKCAMRNDWRPKRGPVRPEEEGRGGRVNPFIHCYHLSALCYRGPVLFVSHRNTRLEIYEQSARIPAWSPLLQYAREAG